jgi:DnaD/phage-associated family protein
MAEQQLGRPLRHIEQKALVWMHDYNNIGSDIILTVLLYCKSIDKSSVSYAEAIITDWWNDGIRTLSQVTDAINELEHRRSFTGHIQKAFEMRRNPTPKQQKFIDSWQSMQIPMELITYAYEKTIEGIDRLSFPYLNSVLQRWMEAGYRTKEDVDTKDKPNPEANKPTARGKQAVPESDNAQAYKSFVYNLDD